MKRLLVGFIAGVLPVFNLLLSSQTSEAGSATWRFNPPSGDWNRAANWQPKTIPQGGADIATFDQSVQTAVSLSAPINPAEITFNSNASAYVVTVPATESLELVGAGLTNNSGTVQNFVSSGDSAGNFGILRFSGNSSAGSLTALTSEAGLGNGFSGGFVQFYDSASAGESTITSNGASVAGANGGETDFFGTSTADQAAFRALSGAAFGAQGGTIAFFGASSAGEGVFTAESGAAEAAFGGYIYFREDSTAAQGTFTTEGGTGNFATGANILFEENATGDQSVITNEGGQTAGPTGGSTVFLASSTAGNATLMATGGFVADAQGGTIFFYDDSSGGTARVELFGNGQLDNSIHNPPGLTIGSLEGEGGAFLGSVDLAVGSNNLSTTFSGIIQDGGINGGSAASLTKIGTGTLTLSGVNTYTGGTTVSAGILLISNRRGSGTGTGPVSVDTGTLSGTGKIAGNVTVGTGSGNGAFLSPGTTGNIPGTLTIQKRLTFNSDATYTFGLKTGNATADKVVAKGVTINSGALFSFVAIGSAAISPGTVFTAIDNTAATPISGTFANLADGSTFTVGSNTFKANYEGGTGNDLTLTVQ